MGDLCLEIDYLVCIERYLLLYKEGEGCSVTGKRGWKVGATQTETARLAVRKGDLTAISGIAPGGEGRIWFQVCCRAQTCRDQGPTAAMWDPHNNWSHTRFLAAWAESHRGLVNRNDQLSLVGVEFVVLSRHPMGIAHLNLSVRGQEEKRISVCRCQSIQYRSNYKGSYGMYQFLCDIPTC